MTEEKPEILKEYTFIKDIGEGNFGKVKLSILNSTNEKYAIKILNKEKLKSQTKSSSFNEIEIISRFKHPNIIHVEKILEDDTNYYIIMEYCDEGELFDYIVKKDKLDDIEASMFFYQLINGIEYIHKQNFVHRDLKPENLLLTKNKILKIIDFGLCHDFNGTKLLKTKCGSPSYAAPEILKGYPYDGFKTDIWCCGIILYGMLCGYLPFDGDDNQEIFEQIIECNLEFPSFLRKDSINLLFGILKSNPKERLTIKQIKRHPFYLKGKNCFLIEYGDEYISAENQDIEENNKNNDEKGNYSENKKKFSFSSVRRHKGNNGNSNTFNNIKSLKINKCKNFKNNIYENIFTDILYDDENNNSNNNKFKHLLNNIGNNDNEKYVNDNEDEKYDKAQKRKINDIAGLTNNNKKKTQNLIETEGNQDRINIFGRKFKNKFKGDKLKIDSKKLLFNNKDKISKKLHLQNYDIDLNSKYKTKESNKNNCFSIDVNLLNSSKSLDKKQKNTITIKNNENEKNSKFIDESIKNNFKEKNNIKELKLKGEKLDFFQKFLLNNKKTQNKVKTLEGSPIKKNGINFNLILTKNRERDKSEYTINEAYPKSAYFKNENEREKQLSEEKKYIKDTILFQQKIRKCNSGKKRIALHSEIELINSPDSNNKNHYYQRNNKFQNKYYESIYGHNNFKEKLIHNFNRNKIKFGCNSCSIRKRHGRNSKINSNKKLKLKIVDINHGGKTVKKESRKIFVKSFPNNKPENIKEIIMNNNNNNLNIDDAFKTEPKYNHFLDKVIQKINSNKVKKIINNLNVLTFNNKFKNEENKKIHRNLNFERNNQDFYNNKNAGVPYLLKYYKNNKREEKYNKNSPIHFKEDKKFLVSTNSKLFENNININNKNKMKGKFPSLTVYNKN